MTQASYNDIAQWYDQFLRERPVYMEVLLPNLLALVGEVEGEVICDLACGQGWVARELARRGAQVTVLDLGPNLLALARGYEEQEPLGIVYVQGDAERAEPLGDHQFTGCVCVMALNNIPDLQATFQSVRRILSQEAGSSLLFLTPVSGRLMLSRFPCPILSIRSAGSSPAILTNERGSQRTRREYAVALPTITACSVRISTDSTLRGLCWNAPSNQAHRLDKLNGCQATAKSPRSC
jgi:SAM-dependent methyltransferase